MYEVGAYRLFIDSGIMVHSTYIGTRISEVGSDVSPELAEKVRKNTMCFGS